jgi:hypothetical protein
LSSSEFESSTAASEYDATILISTLEEWLELIQDVLDHAGKENNDDLDSSYQQFIQVASALVSYLQHPNA